VAPTTVGVVKFIAAPTQTSLTIIVGVGGIAGCAGIAVVVTELETQFVAFCAFIVCVEPTTNPDRHQNYTLNQQRE
jgi:hypothetical protein